MDAYRRFLTELVGCHNARQRLLIDAERAALLPLPARREVLDGTGVPRMYQYRNLRLCITSINRSTKVTIDIIFPVKCTLQSVPVYVVKRNSV